MQIGKKDVYLPRKLIIPGDDYTYEAFSQAVRDKNVVNTMEVVVVDNDSVDTVIIEENHLYICESLTKDMIYQCIRLNNAHLIIFCYKELRKLLLEDGVLENLSLAYRYELSSLEQYSYFDFCITDMRITSQLVDKVKESKSINSVGIELNRLIKGKQAVEDILIRSSLLDFLVVEFDFLGIIINQRKDLFDAYLRFLYSIEKLGVQCSHCTYAIHDALGIKTRVLDGESYESIKDDLQMCINSSLYGGSFDELYPVVKVTNKFLILRIRDKFAIIKVSYSKDIKVYCCRLHTEREIYRIRILSDSRAYPGVLFIDKTKDCVFTTLPDCLICVKDNTTQLHKYLVLGD